MLIIGFMSSTAAHTLECLLFLQPYERKFTGVYTSSNVFCNVRSTCDALENFEAFWLFFDRLVANIAGKKAWRNRDKVGEAITTGGRITIVD